MKVKRLGVIGIGFDEEQIRQVVQKALIHPLDKLILPISYKSVLESDNVNPLDEEIKEHQLDLVAFVEDCQGNYSRNMDVIISPPNPRILAHELGHAVGLEHPTEKCLRVPHFCENCEHYGDVMGYCMLYRISSVHFSNKDLAFLGFPNNKHI